MCLRAKDHLEDTEVGVFQSLCAPQQDQPGSAADWRPPTRKTSGGLTTREGRRPRDDRWWDTDRVRPKRALVQASAVALHDVTGRGSRVKLPLAQPSEATKLHRSAASSGVSERARGPQKYLLTCLVRQCGSRARERVAASPRECSATRTFHPRVGFPPYTLPTGCGEECSDLSGPRAYGSSSSQHDESPAAHLLLIDRMWIQFPTFALYFSRECGASGSTTPARTSGPCAKESCRTPIINKQSRVELPKCKPGRRRSFRRVQKPWSFRLCDDLPRGVAVLGDRQLLQGALSVNQNWQQVKPAASWKSCSLTGLRRPFRGVRGPWPFRLYGGLPRGVAVLCDRRPMLSYICTPARRIPRRPSNLTCVAVPHSKRKHLLHHISSTTISTILKALHGRGSSGIPYVFGTSSRASESIG